jgi:hypothetical protein
MICELIQVRLTTFDIGWNDWSKIMDKANGLTQAEIVRATDEAAKKAVLTDTITISHESLISAILERKEMSINE